MKQKRYPQLLHNDVEWDAVRYKIYGCIWSFSLLYQPTSRSQVAIISKKSIIVTFLPYESLSFKILTCRKIGQDQGRVIISTNYNGLEFMMLHIKFRQTGSYEECIEGFYHMENILVM